MDDMKRTSEYRKMLPFIAKASNDIGDQTLGQEIQALLLALNSHKSSADHDGRYYTETETNSLLSNKADKAITLTAGNGLTGGGDLSANRTLNVGEGTGITVNADDVAINLAANLTWTGSHTFNGSLTTGSILPALSDTYDLGDYTKPWRKIWGSELSAVIFSQYEQVLLGGWLTISKGEGKLTNAVTSAQTQIDLGSNNFATNDIIVFRGISSNGSAQVEYMKVGTLVSGVTFNVTRNLDGTGANDWPEGTVFANYGQAGNGRVELNAYDTPRMSVYSHGAAIADFREQLRFGDLNGNWGYSSSVFGGAFGSYETGKANITVDPTNGIRIRNYTDTVIQLNGTTASFENFITLGANGGLRQGSGTWVNPPGAGNTFTGSAIWAESSSMNIGGWNAGVKQWWGGSDGKFYANGGKIKMGSQGLILDTAINGGSGQLTFQTSGVDTVKLEQVNQYSSFTFGSGLLFKAFYADEAFPSAQGYNYAGPHMSMQVLDQTDAVVSSINLELGTIHLGHVGIPNIGMLIERSSESIRISAESINMANFTDDFATLNGICSVTISGPLNVTSLTSSNAITVQNMGGTSLFWGPVEFKNTVTGTISNADTVDSFHASGTPTVSTIPVAGSNGKLADGWNLLGTNGWITATGSWTINTASTGIINVPDSSIFDVGDKIKLTNSSVKYFYVTAKPSSTTITVYAGTDFALAGASGTALTLCYYSKAAEQSGFPGWFNYTPAQTGWATSGLTIMGRFSMAGKTVTAYVNVQAGTSNATTTTVTSPTTVFTLTNYHFDGILAYAVDNSVPKTTPCRYSLSNGTNIINCYSDLASGTWTASGTKRIRATIVYETA